MVSKRFEGLRQRYRLGTWALDLDVENLERRLTERIDGLEARVASLEEELRRRQSS